MADISHPGKTWEVHQKWTLRLMDEFFKQVHMRTHNPNHTYTMRGKHMK